MWVACPLLMPPLRQLPGIGLCILRQVAPLLQKGIRCDKQLQWLQSGPQLAQPTFVPVENSNYFWKRTFLQSPDRILSLFPHNNVPSWGSLTKAGVPSGAWNQ